MRILKPNSSLLIPLFLLVALSFLTPPTLSWAKEGKTLHLVWSANEEQDLRGYRIYECDEWGNLDRFLGELLVEDIHWEKKLKNIATFKLDKVPPGDHCWAVTAFDTDGHESLPSSPACISLGTQEPSIHMADFHEDGFYGSHPGERGSYDTGVVYTFDGKPGELLLAYRVWDINSPEEVEVLLNGESLGFAAMTGNYEVSRLRTVRIPPEYLETAGLNTLRFEWNAADQDDVWAVGMVEILELIPLPAPDFYGNLANVRFGDTSHPRAVGFMFEGKPGAALVHYQGYDLDGEREVAIFLNGERLGWATTTRDNSYLNAAPLLLPDDLVLDQGVNTIVFSNSLNPPYSLRWGVGDVQISY